jgi:membrane protease YdiL (CAAX protease family)
MDSHHEPDQPLEQPVPLARPILTLPSPPGPARPSMELATLSRGAAAGGVGLILLVLLASLMLSVGVGVIFALRVSVPTPHLTHVLIIIDKWVSAALAAACAAGLLRWHQLSARSIGLRRDRLDRQAGWACAAFFGVYAAFALSLIGVLLLLVLFPGLYDDLAKRGEFLEMLPIDDPAATILLLVAVAIHEELLFRGLLIPYLRRVGCGWVGAVLLSTAIFSLLHVTQGWLAVPQVFCVGLALGVFFVLSRSLTAVIVAHFLFDLVQFQFIRLLHPWMEQIAHRT